MYPIISELTKQELGDEVEEEAGAAEDTRFVTSHVYLKPAHTTGTLNREVVLRRIRHHKRINKVKSAVRAFVGGGSPFVPAGAKEKHSAVQIKWVDDNFAAP